MLQDAPTTVVKRADPFSPIRGLEGEILLDSSGIEHGERLAVCHTIGIRDLDMSAVNREREHFRDVAQCFSEGTLRTTSQVVAELRSARHAVPLRIAYFNLEVDGYRRAGENVWDEENRLDNLGRYVEAFRTLCSAASTALEPPRIRSLHDLFFSMMQLIAARTSAISKKRMRDQTQAKRLQMKGDDEMDADESIAALGAYRALVDKKPSVIISTDQDIARMVGCLSGLLSANAQKAMWLYNSLILHPIRVVHPNGHGKYDILVDTSDLSYLANRRESAEQWGKLQPEAYGLLGAALQYVDVQTRAVISQ